MADVAWRRRRLHQPETPRMKPSSKWRTRRPPRPSASLTTTIHREFSRVPHYITYCINQPASLGPPSSRTFTLRHWSGGGPVRHAGGGHQCKCSSVSFHGTTGAAALDFRRRRIAPNSAFPSPPLLPGEGGDRDGITQLRPSVGGREMHSLCRSLQIPPRTSSWP